MFSWKQHSLKLNRNNIKEEKKDSNEKNSSKKDSSKKLTVIQKCEENIDQNVYKVLTKGNGRRSKPKPEKVTQDDGWKGPREQPSEIPLRRNILERKRQVPIQSP